MREWVDESGRPNVPDTDETHIQDELYAASNLLHAAQLAVRQVGRGLYSRRLRQRNRDQLTTTATILRRIAGDLDQVASTMTTTTERLSCDWCEYEATYSINWECGHASACCVLCFEWSDARDWTMDIMDWQQEPAICPDCAGRSDAGWDNAGPVPHSHLCRPYGRARKHVNYYSCFDSADIPEKQHRGYGEICRDCQDEWNRKYPIPDDGRDDPRYGGY